MKPIGFSARRTLALTLFAIGALAWLIACGVGYLIARAALVERIDGEVVQARESRARALGTQWERLRSQAQALGTNDVIAEALGAFTQAYKAPRRVSFGDLKSAIEDTRRFHAENSLPQLRRGGAPLADASSLVPSQAEVVLIQAAYLARNPHSGAQRERLERAGDGSLYDAAHARYHATLRELRARGGFADLLLVSNQGDIVYSVTKDLDFATASSSATYRNSEAAKALKEMLAASVGGMRYVEFAPYLPGQASSAFFLVPVKAGEARAGLALLRIAEQSLAGPLTASSETTSPADATFAYLVNGTFVSPSQAETETPKPDSSVAAVKRALAGESGTTRWRDAQGRRWLAAFASLSLNDTRWALVALKSESVLTSAMRALDARYLLLTLLPLAAIGALTYALARRLALPVERFGTSIEPMIEGSDGTPALIASGSRELDSVGEGMQRMARALRAHRKVTEDNRLTIEQLRAENAALRKALLPDALARLWRPNGEIAGTRFDRAMILAIEIDGFFGPTDRYTVAAQTALLNDLINEVDLLCRQHGVERIRVAGASFIIAAGVPEAIRDYAERAARLALALPRMLETFNVRHQLTLKPRGGLDCGQVTAAIVGTSQVRYDVWGTAVDFAAALARSAQAGQVEASRPAYEALADGFEFAVRHDVPVDSQRRIDTYVLRKPQIRLQPPALDAA